MTHSSPTARIHEEELTNRTRAVTRSTGTHPGDWGRAVAHALEYLATQVAFRDSVPEEHVLEGRTVLLQAWPDEHGIKILVELASDRESHLDDGGSDDPAAAAERRLRDSVGYGPGQDPRTS
ncbi:hypothetical protein [Frigoribacterium sp. MCBA15_019]|uniref:hypothetical protein n=1 Tax=unclassified Frigoribacterium TaxID=2627005 RepID=UPI0008DD4C7B|nr:hypothetical protein [Frigoribacterium sp. MCBA15_019]OII26064.1 hypothetical protein BIV04_14190 [Frigoribacterium sp. MCBA15_019]